MPSQLVYLFMALANIIITLILIENSKRLISFAITDVWTENKTMIWLKSSNLLIIISYYWSFNLLFWDATNAAVFNTVMHLDILDMRWLYKVALHTQQSITVMTFALYFVLKQAQFLFKFLQSKKQREKLKKYGLFPKYLSRCQIILLIEKTLLSCNQRKGIHFLNQQSFLTFFSTVNPYTWHTLNASDESF